MAKKTNFGYDLVCLAQIWSKKFFSCVLPLLDVIQCCKWSPYAISKKINELNFRKWRKNLVLGPILASLAQIWASEFFFVGFTSTWNYHCMRFQGKLINQTSSVTRYHGQLSSCTISEKTNDPILRKLSDGRTETDRLTDGQTDEGDFIGRCPPNVERPHCFIFPRREAKEKHLNR